MVSLLDKFMLTFVEEAEPSTDMINHPSQHERLTLPPTRTHMVQVGGNFNFLYSDC